MLLIVLKRLRRIRLMGKPTKGTGKRRGNSPYKKYNKMPFPYGQGYRDNYLHNGVLYRNGKPYNPRQQDMKHLEAAE